MTRKFTLRTFLIVTAFTASGASNPTFGQGQPDIAWIKAGHWDWVDSAFSPDGVVVATLGRDFSVKLWNAANGTFLRTLTLETQGGGLAFSPNGQFLALSINQRIRFFRVSDWSVERELFIGDYGDLEFTADGQRVMTHSTNRINVRSVSDGELLGTFSRNTDLSCAAISLDGEYVAGGYYSEITVWRTADAMLMYTVPAGHVGGTSSLSFSPNGMLLATTGDDLGGVGIFRVSNGAVLRRLDDQTFGGRCVAFSPDGTTLASIGGGESHAKLWNISDGALIREFGPAFGFFYGVLTFSPDGQFISLNSGWDLSFWSTATGAFMRGMSGIFYSTVHSIQFLDNDVAAADENSIQFLDRAGGDSVGAIGQGQGSMTDMRIVSEMSSALMMCGGFALRTTLQGDWVWAADAGSSQLDLSPDGETFITDGPELRSLDDGELIRSYGPDQSDSAIFSPDGSIIAGVRTFGFMIVLWDVASGEMVGSLNTSPALANCIAFSPDGRLLAAGGADNAIRIFRVSDQSLVRLLPGHTGSVRTVAFSPDSRILASGATDHTVRFWRVSDGSALAKYDEETVRPASIAFSADGALFGIGRRDATLVVAHNPFLTGDMNCDGSLNQFDIQAFVSALSDPPGYGEAYPRCHWTNADANGDGSINQFDIQGFVDLISSP